MAPTSRPLHHRLRRRSPSPPLRGREDLTAALHPKPDIRREKKTLSYMTRLCQPFPQIFQYVDKSDRCPAGGRVQKLGVACPPRTAGLPPHKADLS